MPRISGSSDEIIRIVSPWAARCEIGAVDVGLRAHVDAVRGLVEDQDARLGREPLGEDDLLLVPAGEAAHDLSRRSRPDPEPVHEPPRQRAFAPRLQEPRPA